MTSVLCNGSTTSNWTYILYTKVLLTISDCLLVIILSTRNVSLNTRETRTSDTEGRGSPSLNFLYDGKDEPAEECYEKLMNVMQDNM